jgi:predicted RNase H-like HicB family nuclease
VIKLNKHILVSEQIWKEGNMYSSYCPELDIASCGKTVKEARKNLKEAIEIFIEETKKLGTLYDLLEEAGYDLSSKDEVLIKRKEIVEFDTIQVSLGK